MNSPTLLVLVKVFMWVALLMPSPPHTHTRSSDSESTKSGQSVCLEDMEVEGVEAWAFFSVIKPYFRGTLCTICGLLFIKKKTPFEVGTDTPPQRGRRRETEQQRSNELQSEWREVAAAAQTKKWINRLFSDCVTAVMF